MKQMIISNGIKEKIVDVTKETKCFIWGNNIKFNKKTKREVGDWFMSCYHFKKIIGE